MTHDSLTYYSNYTIHFKHCQYEPSNFEIEINLYFDLTIFIFKNKKNVMKERYILFIMMERTKITCIYNQPILFT